MALGLQTESGNFIPFLKWDARAGRFFRKPKEGEGDTQIDVTDNFAAVFDLTGIEVGYILFAAGSGPQYVVQPVAKGLPEKPAGEGFKQGFKMNVALSNQLGGGCYELASTSKALIGVIDQIHSVFVTAPEAQQGKLPVYRMDGANIIETKGPTGVNRNYAPRLELVQWVDRPASLKGEVAAKSAQAAQPAQNAPQQPAATGSTQVAPPQPRAGQSGSAQAPSDMAFG